MFTMKLEPYESELDGTWLRNVLLKSDRIVRRDGWLEGPSAWQKSEPRRASMPVFSGVTHLNTCTLRTHNRPLKLAAFCWVTHTRDVLWFYTITYRLLLLHSLPVSIIGNHLCEFQWKTLITDHIFCIPQILGKKWENNVIVHELIEDYKKAYDW